MKHLIPEFDALRAALSRRASSRRWCCRACAASRKTAATSPTSDIDGLVDYLGVPRIQIEEVLCFYTQFRRAADRPLAHPGVPQRLLLAARRRADDRRTSTQKLGIAPGETTPTAASRCRRSSASARAAPRRW